MVRRNEKKGYFGLKNTFGHLSGEILTLQKNVCAQSERAYKITQNFFVTNPLASTV